MPDGCAVLLFFPLCEVFFCPAGFEQSLGLRIERSPPTRLRVRPSSAARRADPRGSAFGRPRLHAAVATLGARTRRRHGSYRPRGGFHRHPRSRMKRSRGPATEQPGPDFNVSSRRVGVSNRQAGASGHASLGRGDPACGPGRGVGDAVLCGHRGAPARAVLLGRGRGSLEAQRAGASKRRAAAHPLGKTKAVPQ